MAYIHREIRGSKIYVYEIKARWDKEKQQSRNERIYLGREDPLTGQLIPKTEGVSVPIEQERFLHAKDYGATFLLQSIAQRIGLTQTLQQIFPGEAGDLLSLAMYQICEGTPLYLYEEWVESAVVPHIHWTTSQELSQFCESIGKKDDLIEAFFEAWIQQNVHPEKDTEPKTTTKSKAEESSIPDPFSYPSLYLDITSFSTYSDYIDYAEWGYNRDHDSLPQINLSLLSQEKTGIPLAYRITPGSIPDVSSLKTTLLFLQELGVPPARLIMDRGFYSAQNLAGMQQMGLAFCIPLPTHLSLASSLLHTVNKQLLSPHNAFLFQESAMFHLEKIIPIDPPEKKNQEQNQSPPTPMTLTAHFFFDGIRRATEEATLIRTLNQTEEAIHGYIFRRYGAILDRMQEIKEGIDKLFIIHHQEDRTVLLTRKRNAISKRFNRFGKMILLDSQTANPEGQPTKLPPLSRDDILLLYRRKDQIEKLFHLWKNDLDAKRMLVHSRESMFGKMFLLFLSVILYSVVLKTLKEKKATSTLSTQKMLKKLKTIRQISTKSGKTFVTDVSKKQREILQLFDLAL
jgi:transposase